MPPVRLALAVLAGVAVTVVSAVVLGDYPLTGAVPWVTPVLVPLLIGVAMTLVAGARNRWLWVATGPLGALAIVWGVRIATGWGLDPWPSSWWAVGAVALLWPPLWGLLYSGGATDAVSSSPASGGPDRPAGPTG